MSDSPRSLLSGLPRRKYHGIFHISETESHFPPPVFDLRPCQHLSGALCPAEPLQGKPGGPDLREKLGHAVVRNRTRRRLREIYRLNEHRFARGYDIVVVARSAAVDADFAVLERAYLNLAKKAGILSEADR